MFKFKKRKKEKIFLIIGEDEILTKLLISQVHYLKEQLLLKKANQKITILNTKPQNVTYIIRENNLQEFPTLLFIENDHVKKIIKGLNPFSKLNLNQF